jgi:WD40 repeat protein
VDTEDLAVGDDLGDVWYYSVEWTDAKSRESHGWDGTIVLLAKISAHTQQVCGLAWSPDDTYLATGGNDNACLLFDISDILEKNKSPGRAGSAKRNISRSATLQNTNGISRFPCCPHLNRIFEWHHRNNQITPASTAISAMANPASGLSRIRYALPGHARTMLIPSNRQKHRFCHSAAVKALAFAPWQPSLLATGGGSNDRCIHFYHAPSGSRLATINVHAQVTSLIWSKTRREIAATFGYALPEHPFRIAVFAWPSCQQIVAIPWGSNSEIGSYIGDSDGGGDVCRALWAISYPGGPNSTPHDANPGHRASSSTTSTTPTAVSIAAAEISPYRSASPESRTWNISTANGLIARSRMAYKEGGTWWPRTAEEGCIIVASSDECVKFHEVWSGARKSTSGSSGQLGGSDILESLEGIDKEDKEIIR